MAVTLSLTFALVIWPLFYITLLIMMRRATIPSPFGFQYLVAFATTGEWFLLPLFSPGPAIIIYAYLFIFFTLLSLVCLVHMLFHPSRSPYYIPALCLLTLGIVVPLILILVGLSSSSS